jgi:hypothetical protein
VIIKADAVQEYIGRTTRDLTVLEELLGKGISLKMIGSELPPQSQRIYRELQSANPDVRTNKEHGQKGGNEYSILNVYATIRIHYIHSWANPATTASPVLEAVAN